MQTRSPSSAIVIATAGHIDHGRTGLVRALTGQETDRPNEEHERSTSIDLGIAHYDLDGRSYGVVDVAGHERFIRNVLAGAHGIDLVLVVVAADDGILPETEEHLDVVHLLGVRRGVFAITKIDLVEPARVEEVRRDIEVLARGTAFATSQVVAVSSATGQGIDELRTAIAREAASLPPRAAHGLFRMPVDRAFAMPGHGLVVTGTAIAGVVREGDALALRPGDLETSARTIQEHGQRVAEAGVGQRVVVSLADLEKDQATHGQMLADPRLEFTSDRFDCWLEVRGGAERALESFGGVRVYCGTAETMARVIVLGEAKAIAPGASGFCQLALEEPLLLSHGDRFLVRSENATRATGGGVVLHAFAQRHKEGEAGLIAQLGALREGRLPARLHAFLELLQEFAAPTGFLAQGLACTPDEVVAAARAADAIVALPSDLAPEAYTTRAKWDRLGPLVVEVLEHFHATHPLSGGMELESARSRLRVAVPPRVFGPIVERMAASGVVKREGATLRLPSHRVEVGVGVGGGEAGDAARVRRAIVAGGVTPPDLKQLESEVGIAGPRLVQLLGVMEKKGEVVRVGDLFFAGEALERARQVLVEWLGEHPEITVAEYRTLIAGSRKYALALLDYFDERALTVRVGDARRLRRG